MGGYGSGRWRSAGRKITVDESLTLDFGWLQREGLLTSGHVEIIQWSIGTDNEATISFHANRDHVLLEYVISQTGSPRHITTEARLVTTQPYFGGERYWVTCPLDSTGRMISKLYLPPGALQFGCRECHNLTYASCQDSSPGWWVYSSKKWTPKRTKEQYVDYFKGISAEVS